MDLSASGWIDITRGLRVGMEVWPGDAPFQYALDVDFDDGGFRVGSVGGSLHAGSHLDAPAHALAEGLTVDQLELDRFIGPVEVIELHGGDELATPERLAALRRTAAPRLLIRGIGGGLDLAAAGWIVERGISLVGVDGPSIAAESDELAVHQRLLARKTVIIENLDLSAAAPGVYDLVALPLKIVGAEAAWLRAALRRRQVF